MVRDVLPRSPVKSSNIGHDAFMLSHARALPRKTCEGVNRERRGLSDAGAQEVAINAVNATGVDDAALLMAHVKSAPKPSSAAVQRERRGQSQSQTLHERASSLSIVRLQAVARGLMTRARLRHRSSVEEDVGTPAEIRARTPSAETDRGAHWPRPWMASAQAEADLGSLETQSLVTGLDLASTGADTSVWLASTEASVADVAAGGPAAFDAGLRVASFDVGSGSISVESDLLETLGLLDQSAEQSRNPTPPPERPRAPTPEWLAQAAETVTSLAPSPVRPIAVVEAPAEDEPCEQPGSSASSVAREVKFGEMVADLPTASSAELPQIDGNDIHEVQAAADDEPEWLSKAGVETGWSDRASAREAVLAQLAADPMNSMHVLFGLTWYFMLAVMRLTWQ